MKSYLGNNYLIESRLGRKLYNKYAKNMPIFDYHCHLNAKTIYENKPFNNLTELWLCDNGAGDHYKWRVMRSHGISEEYITGNKSDYEKFMAFASTMPYAIANPIYTWSHMELVKFFNITKPLSLKTANEIYNEANLKLKTLLPRDMITMCNVKMLCTTDDPVDSLEYHIKLKEDESFKVKVLPTFRPDKALNITAPTYNEWVGKLEAVSGMNVNTFEGFLNALASRILFFNEVGCRVSDHSLEEVLYIEATTKEVSEIYLKARNNEPLTKEEEFKYRSYMMVFFGKEYNKYNWVQQYHINAMRNNSERMFNLLGPDTGFDSLNNSTYAPSLSKLLNKLDTTDELPKTILYSLNQYDNEMLIALAGCFQKDYPGKIQLGSGWWFNDQKDGIVKQFNALSSMGLISHFVGMLTDSRSLLSYPRHDYFRRLLCDFFCKLIEGKEYPKDIEFVGKIIEDICFNNACKYFNVFPIE